jgi:hypothetical protein
MHACIIRQVTSDMVIVMIQVNASFMIQKYGMYPKSLHGFGTNGAGFSARQPGAITEASPSPVFKMLQPD